MAWTHYRLVFRLESPLHIGWRKAGNLMQTRRYVPGKNLWAALTERIVWLAGQETNATAYQKVGQSLKTYLRFGYLWPTYAGRTQDWRPHFPWEAPEVWDYLYLDGTARTASENQRRVAAEGTLHEVEFLSPYTREGQPVYLVGDLWVQVQDDVSDTVTVNGQTLALFWQKALRRLQIGGERTYGWGCVALEAHKKAPLSWGDGWSWKEENGEVVMDGPKDTSRFVHLPVHALAAEYEENGKTQAPLADIQGPVEPWLGWERTAAGFRLPQARIVYAPGARIKSRLAGVLHSWGYLFSG